MSSTQEEVIIEDDVELAHDVHPVHTHTNVNMHT